MTQGTLVMVKIGRTADGGTLRASDLYSSVEWAINHIVTRGRQGKSVINFSMSTGKLNSKLTATAFISICILICYQVRINVCGLIF
jgi:hypothetical protein